MGSRGGGRQGDLDIGGREEDFVDPTLLLLSNVLLLLSNFDARGYCRLVTAVVLTMVAYGDVGMFG
jgi:hypothetical protein